MRYVLLLAWRWCCAGVSEAGHAHETLQKGHAAADVLPGEQPKSNLCCRYFKSLSPGADLI